MTRFFERTEIITSRKKKTEQAESAAAAVDAEESESKSATTEAEEHEGKSKLWKIVLTLDLVLLLLIAGVVGFTYNIRQSDRIFPGISVADIDLGGKTVEEAVSVLDENGWTAMGEKNVTAALPAGYTVTVNACGRDCKTGGNIRKKDIIFRKPCRIPARDDIFQRYLFGNPEDR